MRSYHRWNRWNRRTRAQQIQNGKVFLSILFGLLMIFSLLLTFAIAVDLPLAVSLDLPNKEIAQNIRTNVIGAYPTWRILVTKLLVTIDVITITAALTFALLARSGTNLLHLLRACIAILGMILTIAFVGSKFEGDVVWPMAARNLARTNYHPDIAINTIITSFQNPATVVAIPLFIACIVIFAIRPRDHSKNAPKGAA